MDDKYSLFECQIVDFFCLKRLSLHLIRNIYNHFMCYVFSVIIIFPTINNENSVFDINLIDSHKKRCYRSHRLNVSDFVSWITFCGAYDENTYVYVGLPEHKFFKIIEKKLFRNVKKSVKIKYTVLLLLSVKSKIKKKFNKNLMLNKNIYYFRANNFFWIKNIFDEIFLLKIFFTFFFINESFLIFFFHYKF